LIGRLTGKLIEVDGSVLLVDVSGVAYEVEVSSGVLDTLPRVGEELLLHTHFVVREDAQLLYGFAAKSERDLFRGYIKISGVGPKLGLSLISAIDPNSLVLAVRNNDVSMLTKVPGVGKKTADRLMVELKNRMDALTASGAVPLNVVSVSSTAMDDHTSIATQAQDALVALGYRTVDAGRAVAAAVQRKAEADPEQILSVQELVRLSLRSFARVTGNT